MNLLLSWTRIRVVAGVAVGAALASVWISGCGVRGMRAAGASDEGRNQAGVASDRTGVIQRTLGAERLKVVRVRVKVGSIRVLAGSGRTVRVTASRKYEGSPSSEALKRLKEGAVLIERLGDDIVIGDTIPDDVKNQGARNVRLDVEITMPADLALETNCGVGDVRASGDFGDLKAESGVGNLEISGAARAVTVNCGVGDVRLSELACGGNRLDVKTGTGNVYVSLESLPKESIRAEAGVGDVTVAVPGDSKASVEMQTGVGDLRSAFDLPSRPRGIGEVGSSLNGIINGGGTAIGLHTGTGNARLEKSAPSKAG